ncbi:MAG TPA: hypothetical protein VN833_25685, partial [Candidatus Acidoferrales bacterium]|nr:hypothetical protein [Candidatus Acidoferrales bacterium]
ILLHSMSRDHSRMAFILLRESIGLPRKPHHAHSHGQVVPLNLARAHVLGIGITARYFHVAADATSRRIAVMSIVGRSAINGLQHRVIINAKRIFDSFKICSVTICGDLDATLDSTGAYPASRPPTK